MQIEPCYELKLDASQTATQRFAFISSSGGGKSYGCGRVIEELSDAGVPIVVVDTVGIWFGVRHSADGKGPGLPFYVIGGDHADVPLQVTRGRELALFVVRQNASVVLDVSDLLPEERAGFLADFFEQALIEVKATKRVRFFVLDEAQDLAPEKPGKGEGRLVRAVSGFVRKVRNHNCGIALLTQRPQDVSKSVLNQVGNLFVGMLFGEHERKAIAAWVSSKTGSADAHAQLKRLAELDPGDFYFWSPSWQKLFGKFRFAPKRTADTSSTTPIDVELGKAAPVDLEALRMLLATEPAPLVEARGGSEELKLFADENARLVREVAYLRSELDRTLSHLRKGCCEIAKRLRLEADQLDQLGGYAEAGHAVLTSPKPLLGIDPGSKPGEAAIVVHDGERIVAASPARVGAAAPVRKPRSKDGHVSSSGASPRENARANGTAASSHAGDYLERARRPAADGDLEEYDSRLLAAVAAYGPVSRRQLALVAGVSGISSTFSTVVAYLLKDGWILKQSDGRFVAHEGALAGSPRLVRGKDVLAFWRQRLGDYGAKLLDVVVAHPGGVTRAELAKLAGVSGVSSTFSTTVGQLCRNGFFAKSKKRVQLHADARWAMRV